MLVLTFAGTETSDDDYAEVVAAIRQLLRDAAGRVACAVIVVPKGHAAPNAHWRRQFAEAHESRSGRFLLALATDSPLIRGVFTAVNWLLPSKEDYLGYAVSTFDEAIEQFEKVGVRDLDRLCTLYGEAELGLSKRLAKAG